MYMSSCEKTKIIDVLECYLKVTRAHRGLMKMNFIIVFWKGLAISN